MSLFSWNDKYSVNVTKIDEQHKKLFEIANRLFEAMKTAKTKSVMVGVLIELENYTVYHFTKEEKYMKKFGYASYPQHKKEHNFFVDKVSDFRNDYENGKLTNSLEVMTFLGNWLINHICVIDKGYSKLFNDHGLC